MVTENEKDYSGYAQHISSLSTVLSLLSGFTFTAFTILLTELPNPSGIASQFALVFLAGLFYLFMSLLFWSHFLMIRLIKNVPHASKEITNFNLLLLLGYMGLGLSIVLMLLIWDLIYLALASGVMWVIYIILFQVYLTKPFTEYRKTIH